MGAEFTTHWETGVSPRAAFVLAREEAAYWHGHGGYTGTLAEKDSFVLLDCEAASADEAEHLAWKIDRECIDHPRPENRTHPIHKQYASDKWGPAGAIPVKGGGWLFFGWCSS